MGTDDINDVKVRKCNVCKKNYTSTHCEAMAGHIIYVCDDCIKKTKENFIWICMKCGTVHMRNKKMIISRIKNPNLKRAYMLCEGMQIIQGIDMCVACDPEGVLEYMKSGFC